ncbi:MAG: trypsin-like peptidase domain-containing protein [Gammaproteobacteria bacterium]
MRRIMHFLLQATGVGLVAALVLVFLIPQRHSDPVVELRQAAPAPVTGQGFVSYADAVDRAAPAVVNIYTRKTIARAPLRESPLFERFFGDEYGNPQRRTVTSLGSGVIVNSKGYVLTSNHVIADADQIEVLVPAGISVAARIVGADPETDLAVLKIQREGLPAITVGDSKDLRVGDVVLAIGNPFGVGQTVTQGIVSATGRDRLGINTFEDFIQTDAAINQGNSGGALINAYGDLVGINTAILSRSGGSQGIGFAVPASLARDVLTQIIKTGRVVRGWLGVEAQDLSPPLAESFELARPQGVLVAGVVREGPAQQAGIAPGDVITRLDGQAVRDARHALALIARHKPGEMIHIGGVRAGREFELRASVSQRPLPPGTAPQLQP